MFEQKFLMVLEENKKEFYVFDHMLVMGTSYPLIKPIGLPIIPQQLGLYLK